MRIGVFIEPWINQLAGISVFTEGITRASLGSRHTFVTIGSEPMVEELEHISIPRFKTSFYNPLRYFGISKLDLKKHSIDILIDPGHYATLGLFEVKSRFVVVHDLTPILFPKFHKISSVLAQRSLLKPSLNQSDRIITVSDQTKKDVSEHFGFEGKLHRVYPGVRDFSDVELGWELTRVSGPFILAVGTIEPRKNHQRLLKAFDKFCLENEAVSLVIVGDSGWKVDLKTLIDQSPNKERITFLGYVSKAELKTLYKQALLSVYVSLYEGFGFPVAEAMKLGCPVITSNLGSMKEIAGSQGIVVDPTSVDEISQAMLTLVENDELRKQSIDLATERILQFTWENAIQELDKIIDLIR
jgi:glycosyltransferase involved in cell wall biosynthesis